MKSAVKVVLVSKCLIGVNCRYDCSSKLDKSLLELIYRDGFLPVPFCPEELGELPTPRPPSFFVEIGGVVKNSSGKDVSSYFKRGAEATLKIAKLLNPQFIILKEKSPSCGVKEVYFRGKVIKGEGMTTSLLRKNGFKVISSEEFKKNR